MKTLITILFLSVVLVSCEKKDEDVVYTTIKGNTYICKTKWSWDHDYRYIIYSFNNDSIITIEERMGSVTGKLDNRTTFGYFKYNYPDIDLEINEGYVDCFNYFKATVSEDKKSFSYKVYDIGFNKTRMLEFVIQ